ncbi:retrovirus-related pol polyprotein from transposon TNT 1-94 [Tanacetum coccineum]
MHLAGSTPMLQPLKGRVSPEILCLGGVSKPGNLAAKVWDVPVTKVASWDDLAFKSLFSGGNVKNRIFANVDPCFHKSFGKILFHGIKNFDFKLLDDKLAMEELMAKSTWDDLILYNEWPSDVKESRVMDLKLCYNTFKFKEDFQDSPDDEEDTRSSHEYLNDLEEEYQARALLAKFKRFFKKGTASKAAAVKNKGLIIEAYEWDEEEVSSNDNEMAEVKVLTTLAEENDGISKEGARNGEWVKISMRKLLLLEQEKLDFLTMYHVNIKSLKENKNSRTKLKELIAITETWLNSSKKVNQCISEQIPSQKKRILRVYQLTEDPSSYGKKGLVFVKSSADDTKVTILGVERPWLSEDEGFILPNHYTGRILPHELQRNTTDPLVSYTDSSATDYDSAGESLVCSNPLPSLKKLDGDEPVFRLKTIKSILKSKSTLKAKTLKGVKINEPYSARAKGNKSFTASKVNSALASKLKCAKIKDDPPLAIVMKELNDLKSQISKNQIISLERDINLRNPQHAFKRCEACGSSTNTTTNHYDIEWFKIGEALQAKKDKALKSTRAESNANRSKTPTKRHINGVKSYLHKYMEQPGPKVVFGDDSTCVTKGYGSIKCNGIVFIKVAFVNGLKYNLVNISQLCDAKYIVQFDDKRGTIFNSNKEIIMIALRVRDVYVLDMTSSSQEYCFFAKASENLNWLWHKRLAHLNFKIINKLAKQNLVIGLPSLVYSKDKPCLSY